MPENHNHSILKSSCADDPHDENRHVHFDKMKEVQVYDPNTGSLMGQTPTKEKAFETISSGGILTPQLSDMDISQSPNASIISSVASIDKTFHHFDVSINDTLSLFDKEPAAEEFKFPEFDPSVANPSFLCPKIVKEFESVLLEELTKTQSEILKKFEESDGEYRKKLEFLKNSPAGEWAKDEQNLIVVSSQIAESLLLNLRSKFFADKNEKCEQEIVDLQKENAEIAESIKQAKLEKKNLDFLQVQNEYYDTKKQEMRIRLDSVMILYEQQLEREKKRALLEMEVEELQIQLKSVAEKEKEAKESFEKLILDIDVDI